MPFFIFILPLIRGLAQKSVSLLILHEICTSISLNHNPVYIKIELWIKRHITGHANTVGPTSTPKKDAIARQRDVYPVQCKPSRETYERLHYQSHFKVHRKAMESRLLRDMHGRL